MVSRSSIAGTVSKEQFETAVTYLETRYGIYAKLSKWTIHRACGYHVVG